MSGLENKPIYCEAKKHLHIACPPLDCEICRWKNECVIYEFCRERVEQVKGLQDMLWRANDHQKYLETQLERIRSILNSIEQKKLAFIECCKETKLEVYDAEAKESWLVVTIDPEAYRTFDDKLDIFLLELERLKKEASQ